MPQDALNSIAQETGNQEQAAPSQTPNIDQAVSGQQDQAPVPQPTDEQVQPPKVDMPDEKAAEDPVREIAESTGYSMESLSASWDEKGELPADAYKSLEKAGFSREIIDQACQNIAAGNSVQAQQQVASFQNEVAAHIGGADVMATLIEYTDSPTFDPEVRKQIDALIDIDNPAAAKLAMEKVKSMYEKEHGKDGNLLNGARSTGGTGDVFTSRSEQSKALVEASRSGDASLMKQAREKAARTSRHNRKSGVNWT